MSFSNESLSISEESGKEGDFEMMEDAEEKKKKQEVLRGMYCWLRWVFMYFLVDALVTLVTFSILAFKVQGKDSLYITNTIGLAVVGLFRFIFSFRLFMKLKPKNED
jgi:putative flippase GtrA